MRVFALALLVLQLAAAPVAIACDEQCNEGFVFSDSAETCVPKTPPST